MAIISDIAGTTQNSFSINGKLTLYQIESKNAPDETMGQVGDICSNENGKLYLKIASEDGTFIQWRELIGDKTLPLPEDYQYKLLYSTGELYNCTPNLTYEDNILKLSTDLTDSNEITINDVVIPNIGYLNAKYILKNTDIEYKDNDNKVVAKIHNGSDINSSILELSSIYDNDSNKMSKIQIISKDDKQYATAPTPSDNASGNEIITAEWVKNNVSIKKMGELIWSPVELNDLGLELCNGKRLPKNQYIDFYNYITGKTDNNIKPIPSEWANDLNTDGTIKNTYREINNTWGYFYYDNNFIWLPDYSNEISLVPSANISNIGNYYKGGIPDITGSFGYVEDAKNDDNSFNANGAFEIVHTMEHAAQGSGDDEAKIGFKASNGETKISGVLQNDVYGKSDVVTPEHIKIYIYIVVASKITGDYGAINIESLINTITSYQNDVIDLSNEIHNEINDINEIVNGMLNFPDYTSAVSLNNEGIVPFDGWIHFKLTWDGSGAKINDITVCDVRYNSDGTNTEWNIYPVKSGDTYSIWGSGSVTIYPFI